MMWGVALPTASSVQVHFQSSYDFSNMFIYYKILYKCLYNDFVDIFM